MNLKRIVALIMTLAMAMGTVTPALAAEGAVSRPVSPPGLVLPVGDELSDEELAEIRGEFIPVIVGAVVGAAASAIVFALDNWDEEKDLDWGVRLVTSATFGAIAGGIGAGLAGAAATTAGQIGVGVYSAAKTAVFEKVLSHDPSEW